MMTIQNNIHTPVLLNEVLLNLCIKQNGLYVDCTAGFGGHSSQISKQLKSGKLFCIDQDYHAIKHLNNIFKGNHNVQIIHDNFMNIDQIIKQPVDGIIMDLGVSSLMFDDPTRGFSYNHDGPLDMRMNLDSNLTAADIINIYSKKQLFEIFKKYGEVKSPNKVINAIIKSRKEKPIQTTAELSKIITDCSPGSILRKHPAKIYFQALRIVVNNELEALSKALDKACQLLKPKGRLCVITFHSLEDRIVKNKFKDLTISKDIYDNNVPISFMSKPTFKLITKKPIIPSEEEINKNRRSHSAKLRVIEKL